MKLLFEYQSEGNGCAILPPLEEGVGKKVLKEDSARKNKLRLPNLSENQVSRHYSALEARTFGVNDGFYPLGSCTMKYNPQINNQVAGLSGFADIHPLQPVSTAQGCLEALYLGEQYFCEITGMDAMTFQPAAGAHGEFTGLLLIKKYHDTRGDTKRTKVIIPDSSHGTNPASATMAGLKVVSVPTREDGCVNLEKLREAVGEDTAGLMLTNPNTLGIFEKDILEMAEIVHNAGGLLYYDGANLNPIMGIARPGDMGFDVVHLNLHKTFSTPHGGGGPGSGPVGCKKILADFLPVPRIIKREGGYGFGNDYSLSIGRMRSFYGNFLVMLRALTYVVTLGADGVREAAENAVLNANYLMKKLEGFYEVKFKGTCMHEFVLTLEQMKKDHGIAAMDIAKGMLDYGVHPPTMYFPISVPEALMVEPTETESMETLDEAAEILIKIYKEALENPESLHNAPYHTPVRRLDEVNAARNPKIKYEFQ